MLATTSIENIEEIARMQADLHVDAIGAEHVLLSMAEGANAAWLRHICHSLKVVARYREESLTLAVEAAGLLSAMGRKDVAVEITTDLWQRASMVAGPMVDD